MRYYITPEEYALAQSRGIKKNIVYQRFYAYGWTIEDAISKPVKRRESIYPKWVWDTLNKNKIDKFSFYWRIAAGWELDKAITKPIKIYKNNRRKK